MEVDPDELDDAARLLRDLTGEPDGYEFTGTRVTGQNFGDPELAAWVDAVFGNCQQAGALLHAAAARMAEDLVAQAADYRDTDAREADQFTRLLPPTMGGPL
ncbi:hypothetical protein [Nocardioides limicola]|uniref:hypothetical protein n=1 Tax=Nocardioides limicola TaxID=2803368 RepID=UPI00193BBE7E|nr:hypothetical protein [Nocardioides sp. DJM-14]